MSAVNKQTFSNPPSANTGVKTENATIFNIAERIQNITKLAEQSKQDHEIELQHVAVLGYD